MATTVARLKTLAFRAQPMTPRLQTQQPGSWRTTDMGANARGYTYQWQQASKRFLAEHPLCQCPNCDEGNVRVTAASVVDHKIPHNGNMDLFWDRSNWQALGKACHDGWKARLERKSEARTTL